MTCETCGEKPKKCGNCNKDFPRAVIEINNPETLVLLRKVVIPASMGAEEQVPAAIGKYHNVILKYEANNHVYLYSSDGIPTLLEMDVPQEVWDSIDELQEEIDEIKNNPDVVDIVDTYADLESYDTSELGDNDIIRVLNDETHDGESTYYRWNLSSQTWTFIGGLGPYYTKDETDALIESAKNTWVGEETTSSESGTIAEITTISGDFEWNEGHTITVNFKYKASRYSLKIDSENTYYIDSTKSFSGGIDSGTAIQYTCVIVGGERMYRPIGRLRASSDVAGPVFIANNLTSGNVGLTALSAYQGKVLNDMIGDKQDLLTAGANITINANNEISATDTTYSPFIGTDGQTAGSAGLVPAPATTDDGKFLKADGTWDTAGSSITVVQTIGQSTTDVMSQKAVTDMVFVNNRDNKIRIGSNASISYTGNGSAIAIGSNASVTQDNTTAIGTSATVSSSNGIAVGRDSVASNINTVALGRKTTASGENSIAIGWNATATQKGQFDISLGSNQTAGYNSSNYRLITGVYDPQSAHDAATKGYVDSLIAALEARIAALENT